MARIMDPFARLPMPFPLEIIKHVPDFQSLQMLLRASPAAAAIFRGHGMEIIAAIATTTLHYDIPMYLDAVLSIHRGIVPEDIGEVGDFLERYLAVDTWPPAAGKLRKKHASTSAAVAHRIVSIAANIERLTAVVLTEFLGRLAASRPARPINLTRELVAQDLWFGNDYDFTFEFERYTFPPQMLGGRPFSWVEAHRVRRALWQLQVLLDVRSKLPFVHWPPSSFLGGILPGAREVQLLGQSKIESSYTVTLQAVTYCLGRIGPNIDKSLLLDDDHDEQGDPGTIPRLPRTMPRPATEPEIRITAVRPRSDSHGRLWRQDESAMARRGSPGKHKIVSRLLDIGLARDGGTSFISQHGLPEWPGLLCIGFSIWDLERLVLLGLADPPGTDPPAESDEDHRQVFLWMSITKEF